MDEKIIIFKKEEIEKDQIEESPAAKPSIHLINGYNHIKDSCSHFPKAY